MRRPVNFSHRKLLSHKCIVHLVCNRYLNYCRRVVENQIAEVTSQEAVSRVGAEGGGQAHVQDIQEDVR